MAQKLDHLYEVLSHLTIAIRDAQSHLRAMRAYRRDAVGLRFSSFQFKRTSDRLLSHANELVRITDEVYEPIYASFPQRQNGLNADVNAEPDHDFPF
jgi:hypothetical protein